jgi:outer membrane protein OmpA-like peptidoglycan-associated protein
MKSLFSKSYPQPPGAKTQPSKPYLTLPEDDRSFAVLLSSVAAVSLALAVGFTYATSNADTAVQVVAEAKQPEPARPKPAATPERNSQSQKLFAFTPNALPRMSDLATVSNGIVPQHEQAPVITTTVAPAMPQPDHASEPEIATTQAAEPAPVFALVDETTGELKRLDSQSIVSLLSPADTTAQAPDQDTVTRLNANSLTSVQPASDALPQDCVVNLRRLAEDSTIYFLSGGAQLSPRGIAKARAVGAALTACPEAVVQVSGHSDASGNEQANIAMSWQRADNTIAILEGMGFDTSRMDPVGFGARLPLEQGDTSDELDRRVEFRVMAKR